MGQTQTSKASVPRKKNEEIQDHLCMEILEGLTTNCGIDTTTSDRRGREVKIPPVMGIKGRIQTLREASFQIHGPRF